MKLKYIITDKVKINTNVSEVLKNLYNNTLKIELEKSEIESILNSNITQDMILLIKELIKNDDYDLLDLTTILELIT